MHFAGPTSWIAPLATGHPLGLPALSKQPQSQQKVQPPNASRGMGRMMSDGQPPPQPGNPRRELPDPATHVAPPTIMQLKISQILDDQALKIREAPEEAQPEQGRKDGADDTTPRAATPTQAEEAVRGYEALDDMHPDSFRPDTRGITTTVQQDDPPPRALLEAAG